MPTFQPHHSLIEMRRYAVRFNKIGEYPTVFEPRPTGQMRLKTTGILAHSKFSRAKVRVACFQTPNHASPRKKHQPQPPFAQP